MKNSPSTYYAVVAVLIVLSPLLIIALHYHNHIEQFAASQGGALVQLMSSHVASEQEVAENLEWQKRQVTKDIMHMTEPESNPGPKAVPSDRYNNT